MKNAKSAARKPVSLTCFVLEARRAQGQPHRRDPVSLGWKNEGPRAMRHHREADGRA